MEENKWLPKILYIGRDHDLEKKVSESFDEFNKYQSCRSSQSSAHLLKNYRYDIVICDEEIFATEAYEKNTKVELKDLYNYALQMYPKITFILLFSKRMNSYKDFVKKNTTTLIFDRQQVSVARICYSVHLLNRKEFRSLILLDIVKNQKALSDLYTYDYQAGCFNLTYKKDELIDLNHLINNKIDRLYFKTHDFDNNSALIDQFYITSQLNLIRKKYKALLSDLIDDSKLNDIQNGTRLRADADEIVNHMILVIKSVKNMNDCLFFLPYGLNTLVTHGINTAFYSLILSHIVDSEYNKDLAVASLLHDIGLSYTDFHIIKKHKTELTIKDKIDIEKHVEFTLQIINFKLFRSSKIIDESIQLHHETNDGLGFPSGKKLSNYSNHTAFLGIIDALDRVLAVKRIGIHRTFIEALDMLIQTKSPILDEPKYNQDILKRLKIFLLKEKLNKVA